mgnify:CR=1 FL=1
MDIKVKEVNFEEQKSQAEIEEKLLKDHDEKQNVQEVGSEPTVEAKEKPAEIAEEQTPVSELNDTDVLKYIKNRYDKDISSVDELFAQTKDNDDLPEDVSAYFKYKKETGRGIEDFVSLQKDYESMEDDQLLANYYKSTEDGLDSMDIQDLIEDKFSYDEDLDEVKDVKKAKLAKKRELAKAKKFLNEQKDKYKIPLESSGGGLSQDQEKNLNAYKSYVEESKTVADANKKKYEYFHQKTDEVFTNDFKGFDFNVGDDKNITYKPGTSEELKNVQSDFNNFLNKFMDDSGLIKDAKEYHKAISVAMNPEKFAQHFYNQGVSNTVDNVSKKSKNINMDIRQSQQSVSKDGSGIRAVQSSNDNGRGLKIRSLKRV